MSLLELHVVVRITEQELMHTPLSVHSYATSDVTYLGFIVSQVMKDSWGQA